MENTYQVHSGEKEYQVSFAQANGNEGQINSTPFALDIIETKTGFHVLKNNKAYTVDVLSIDHQKKVVELRINHKNYHFEVKDKYDELLEKLGMDRSSVGQVSEIKAPMPGLVLDVLVSPGDEIKINQPLIILEAMKMENVIKSPVDSSIKKIEIIKGDSVEKNQVLVSFN